MRIASNRALLFFLPGRNGGAEQRLQIGPGGPHSVPEWIRETETFRHAKHDGSLREIEAEKLIYLSDLAALSPGRDYPRWMYHPVKHPCLVANREEEAELGQEWSRVYVHQEFPKVRYHWSGKDKTVKNSAEEEDLGGGWANSPGAFDPYCGPRPARTDEQDPTKWVDGWAVIGAFPILRRRVQSLLLKADTVFDRSPNPDSGSLVAMRLAFDGIAGLLFDFRILSTDVLEKQLPAFVWDSAIAGGWWRLASESRRDIFPEQIGRYWVWRGDDSEAQGLFRAEIRHWRAALLDLGTDDIHAITPSEPAAAAKPIRFKIALSFPGKRRDFVLPIAQALAASIGKENILYDGWLGAEFARPNLDVYLPKLYLEESLLRVFFFCEDFARNEWCGLEWRAGRALLTREQDHRLMLLRLDDAAIPGLNRTDGSLDISRMSPTEVADEISKRLNLIDR